MHVVSQRLGHASPVVTMTIHAHVVLDSARRGAGAYAGAVAGVPGKVEARDPLQEQAVEVFAGQLAADRVPPVRAIRARFRVGQPRAQRLRAYLAAGARREGSLAA
jgi:hypothetical protein